MSFSYSYPRFLLGILQQPEQAGRAFADQDTKTAGHLFLVWHLGFLLSMPVFQVISPLALIQNGGLPSWKALIIAPALGAIALLFAWMLDRMLEFERPPGFQDQSELHLRNLSLFYHLPVSASAPFFFLHPLIGFLFLLVSILYSLAQSIAAHSRLRHRRPLDILSRYLFAVVLAWIPLLFVLFIWNMKKTLSILTDLGIL